MSKNNVVKFVRDELVSFTGLESDTVDTYIARKKYPHFKDEWDFWKPESDANINWFYVTSRTYLFANASHNLSQNIIKDIKQGSNILDFGGGSGNFSFQLESHGCNVQYFDVNLLQKEFVKFVSNKHSLNISVLNADKNYYPLINDKLDAIIALDVLEHIPNYDKYIERLAKHCNNGANIYIFAPFSYTKNSKEDPTHLPDTKGLNNVLSKNNFTLNKTIEIVPGVNCLVYTYSGAL